MTVSNEDREAAIDLLDGTPCLMVERYKCAPTREEAGFIVDALISHGWGPRPTVPAADLTEVITQAREAGPASAYYRLVNRLRELGIEVTDQ